MIEPEITDDLLTLITAILVVGFGIGFLIIVAAVLGAVIRVRWMSRHPSAEARRNAL